MVTFSQKKKKKTYGNQTPLQKLADQPNSIFKKNKKMGQPTTGNF